MGVVRLLEQADESLVFEIFVGCLVLVIIICLTIYKICFDTNDEDEYRLLSSDHGKYDIPRDFLNDESSLARLADTYDFSHLSPEEQSACLKGEQFTVDNPPNFANVRGKSFTADDDRLIRDCGIDAYSFSQDVPTLSPRFIVADKTEINFLNNDTPYSTATSVLNYALPVKYRSYSDTVYFETKIFEFFPTPNGHFSIGLVTKPYPSSFRLPGYNTFSIGYESTGNLKINKPLPTPLQQHQGERSEYNALVLPPLSQSDVVGFGYVVSSGTLFITRNGKKVLDVMKGCYVDLYPAIGCFSTNAKFQVNLGQMGFVWIEANVRKYGFVSTSDFKKLAGERGLAALPGYENAETDKILDKGDDLPPKYPDEELDFFGRSIKTGTSKLTNWNVDNYNKSEKELIENEKLRPAADAITDDPEEVMDLRERLYEQNIQNSTEFTPLIANTPDIAYHSTEQYKHDKPGKIILSSEDSDTTPSPLPQTNAVPVSEVEQANVSPTLVQKEISIPTQTESEPEQISTQTQTQSQTEPTRTNESTVAHENYNENPTNDTAPAITSEENPVSLTPGGSNETNEPETTTNQAGESSASNTSKENTPDDAQQELQKATNTASKKKKKKSSKKKKGKKK